METDFRPVIESKMSTVFSMLPTSLQSRIRPIHSLRRSLSFVSVRTDGLVSGLSPKPRPLSEADAMTLDDSMADCDVSGQGEQSQFTLSTSRSMTQVLYSKPLEEDAAVRAPSGVHWKFARQGRFMTEMSRS